MTTPIIIRIRQEGFTRSAGFQLTQWGVTIPVIDPPSTPPIATSPLSYATLFVLRDAQGWESFERVALLKDLAEFRPNELKYFEARGVGGNTLFLQAQVNDLLTLASDSLDFWLQSDPPYDNQNFFVNSIQPWFTGSVNGLVEGVDTLSVLDSRPRILLGNTLLLPNYPLTNADIGRWVFLTGFATSAYNTGVQILSVAGSSARINLTTTTNETGSSWQTRRVLIQVTGLAPGYEPRYFPTKVNNVPWRLSRGSTTLVENTEGGGFSVREFMDPVFRSQRVTTVEASLDDALNLKTIVQAATAQLQRAATTDNTNFAVETTSTYGP